MVIYLVDGPDEISLTEATDLEISLVIVSPWVKGLNPMNGVVHGCKSLESSMAMMAAIT